ncbi:MAG: zinc-ribbon domain-containing protein, partial [Myxococcota bacterium]
MIVECPSCATRFNLDESRIGERGAKVRCSVCSHSFVVHASSPIGDEVTAVDPESIVPIPGGDTVTDVMPTEAVPTNRYDFTPFLSGTPPQAMQDLQPTVPGGPELVENDDIIEIGADEVDELSGYSSTGTIPTLDPSVGGHETVPGLSVSGVHSAPQTSVDPAEFLEIEEPSSPGGYYSAPPESMMTVQTSPGAFAVTSADVVDPFAPAEESVRPPNESLAPVETSSPPGTAGDFSVETKPHSNPLSLASNFESHSTAVFNVAQLAQLAQSPEAMPDAPSLDADIPGGLGPSADQVGTGRAMLPRLTDSAFDGPPSRLRSVASMILTLLMLAGIIAGSVYTLVYTGRLDPDTVGLEGVVAA